MWYRLKKKKTIDLNSEPKKDIRADLLKSAGFILFFILLYLFVTFASEKYKKKWKKNFYHRLELLFDLHVTDISNFYGASEILLFQHSIFFFYFIFPISLIFPSSFKNSFPMNNYFAFVII